MDKTAVYFEDNQLQTVDLSGHCHVVMKSTGFALMQITVVVAVWADGCKTPPMVIHKKKDMSITRVTGPLLVANQEKG